MRNVRNGYTRFNKTLTTFHSEEFKSQFVLNATVEWQEKTVRRNVPGIHCQGLDFLSAAIEMSTYGFSSGSASFNLLFQRGIFINVSPHFAF